MKIAICAALLALSSTALGTVQETEQLQNDLKSVEHKVGDLKRNHQEVRESYTRIQALEKALSKDVKSLRRKDSLEKSQVLATESLLRSKESQEKRLIYILTKASEARSYFNGALFSISSQRQEIVQRQ